MNAIYTPLSREQVEAYLYSSINGAAILHLLAVYVPGSDWTVDRWWSTYVQAALPIGANRRQPLTMAWEASLTAGGLARTSAAAASLTEFGARQYSKRVTGAFTARIVRGCAVLILRILAATGAKKFAAYGAMGVGALAAAPSGGLSITLAAAGLALDALSVYDVVTMRRRIAHAIAVNLVP